MNNKQDSPKATENALGRIRKKTRRGVGPRRCAKAIWKALLIGADYMLIVCMRTHLTVVVCIVAHNR